MTLLTAKPTAREEANNEKNIVAMQRKRPRPPGGGAEQRVRKVLRTYGRQKHSRLSLRMSDNAMFPDQDEDEDEDEGEGEDKDVVGGAIHAAETEVVSVPRVVSQSSHEGETHEDDTDSRDSASDSGAGDGGGVDPGEQDGEGVAEVRAAGATTKGVKEAVADTEDDRELDATGKECDVDSAMSEEEEDSLAADNEEDDDNSPADIEEDDNNSPADIEEDDDNSPADIEEDDDNSPADIEEDDDNADQMWYATGITAQDGNRYLVAWSGTQTNGKPWPPSWEPKENLSEPLLKAWKDRHATSWEVEKILRYRQTVHAAKENKKSEENKQGTPDAGLGKYLVKWAGKQPNGKPWPCTWEPEENIDEAVLTDWATELQARLEHPDACDSDKPAKIIEVIGECPYDAAKLLVQGTKRQMMVKVENVPYGMICAWDGNVGATGEDGA